MKPTVIIMVWITMVKSSSGLQPTRLKEKSGSPKYLKSKAMANENLPYVIIKLLMGKTSNKEAPSASLIGRFVRQRSKRSTDGITEQAKLTSDLGTTGCASFACAADKAAKRAPDQVKILPIKTIKTNSGTSNDRSISGILSKLFSGLMKGLNVLKKLKPKLKKST